MKKRLAAFLAMALSASMLLAGCGSDAAETTAAAAAETKAEAAATEAAAPSADAEKLTMGTGGTTGTYYAFGGVIANVINGKDVGVNINVQSTGASKANIYLVNDGEADLAIVQNDVMDYGYNGTDLFAEEGAASEFATVGALYAEVCQVVSTKDITSIADLKGKRVSVGDAGSGTEFNARQILGAYDIAFDDIQVENLDFGNSATALKDGKIDAFFCVAGAPTNNIVDLCTNTTISILGVDDEHVSILQKDYSFYTAYNIDAGTYNGVDYDVQAVAVKATMLVSDELSEDVVYALTKALFETADQMNHEKASFLTPEYAVDGFDDMPIHPGALKYYQEVGVK